MSLAGFSVHAKAPIASAAPPCDAKEPPKGAAAVSPTDSKTAPAAAPPKLLDDQKLKALKEISASICTGLVMYAKKDYGVCIHATCDDSLMRDSLAKYGKDSTEKVHRIPFAAFDDKTSKPTVGTIYTDHFRGILPKARCSMALVHCALDVDAREIQLKFVVCDLVFSKAALTEVYDGLCESFRQRAQSRSLIHAKLLEEHKMLVKTAADLMRMGPTLPAGFSLDYDPAVFVYDPLENKAARDKRAAEVNAYHTVAKIYGEAIPQVLGSIDRISSLMKKEPIAELKLLKGKIKHVRKYAEDNGLLLVFNDNDQCGVPGGWDKIAVQGGVKDGSRYGKIRDFLRQFKLHDVQKEMKKIGILIYQMRSNDLTLHLCIP